jgi:uridine phosphorylase
VQSPILNNKDYAAPSVFTAENMLREARRQKSLEISKVPPICILDPDGDIVKYLKLTDQATLHNQWACYHTRLYTYTSEGIEYGIIPHVVGASFAVLVAEELFVSGCELLISMTSAGQIKQVRQPPYCVLIERALRDEGTSYHYLPPGRYSTMPESLHELLQGAFDDSVTPVLSGASWTTDAPFRETITTIDFAQEEGILGVEMEAAALYAFAQAKTKPVICFAHITNQMAQIEGDFEKGQHDGSLDAQSIINLAARRWLEYSIG